MRATSEWFRSPFATEMLHGGLKAQADTLLQLSRLNGGWYTLRQVHLGYD